MHHRAHPLLSVLLVGVTAGATGCSEAGTPLETSAIPGTEEFAFDSGMTTRQRLVVVDAASWASVWSQITAKDQPPPALPSIDFGSRVVVVAAMGTKPTGGHRIAIDDVRSVDGDVQISVTEESPGAGCSSPGVETAPAAVIAVSRFDGKATFIEHASTIDCK